MIPFRGVLIGDCKPTDCEGEYSEIDDAGNIRGWLAPKKRIEPGAFRLTLADGGTLEIFISFVEHDPSGGRHKSRCAARVDFEGRLLHPEPAQ